MVRVNTMFKLKSAEPSIIAKRHAPRCVRVRKQEPTPGSEVLTSLNGDDGQLVTEMRTSDGFINATKMCSSAFTKTGNKKKKSDWEDANKPF
jgi:hypothetical protein